MTFRRAGPVRWLSGRALGLHATLLAVGGGCLYAGWFELSRARAGNELSWVYVFEWPFFAAFAALIWWRSLHDDGTPRAAPARAPAKAAAAPPDSDDEQLRAWQDYVARLNARHPPGGPPPRPDQPRSS